MEKFRNHLLRTYFPVFALIILILSVIPSFAADKVFFYHTDAAGTPMAMTDASGNVTWQADYKPFGEEHTVSGSIENKNRFVGKEKDEETDLYYFGARYLDARSGRFIKPDPVGIRESDLTKPQRFNRYAYGLNNPYRYVDPDGRWPSKILLVHQASINRVLSSLSDKDRHILNQQQVEIDVDQSSSGSFRHSMRDPMQQSPNEAREAANNFVRNEIQLARILEKHGQHERAMVHLGNAMHTMQDDTSPAHQGYQEWDEHASWQSKAGHVQREAFDPGAGSALDTATQRAWDIFRSNEPVPREILPRP